ncbi:MAG: hypothetical protein MZV70_60640 [Desulfobacterales bacterium]|nr:hypothetical protein [Desulfobacterales bacterium]
MKSRSALSCRRDRGRLRGERQGCGQCARPTAAFAVVQRLSRESFKRLIQSLFSSHGCQIWMAAETRGRYAMSSVYKKVGIASLVMMASVFLSRVVGLLREMTIAWRAGAGAEVDAYQIAFILPEILNHVVATGFLSVTFIPLFTRHLVQQREAEAWRVFSIILCVFGSAAPLAGGASPWCFAPQLVACGRAGPGRPGGAGRGRAHDPHHPAGPGFSSAGGLLMAVQFARERFFLPALAPLIYNLGIIAGGLLLGPWLGIEGFAWGVLAGAFGGQLRCCSGRARAGSGLRFQPAWEWRHPDVQRLPAPDAAAHARA